MKKILVLIILFIIMITNEPGLSQVGNWQRVYSPWALNTDCSARDICESSDNNYFLIGLNGYPFGTYIRKLNGIGQVLDTTFLINYECITEVSSTNGSCVLVGYYNMMGGDRNIRAIKLKSDCNIEWLKDYPNTTSATCNKVIKTRDNKFVACGYISYLSAFVIKLDSSGNQIWLRTYTAPFSREFFDVIETNSGNYILTGLYHNTEANGYGRITRVDTSGNIIWDKNLINNGKGIDVKSINNLGDKYLIGSGIYDSIANEYLQGFIKIDESGNIIKSQKYPSIPNYYQVLRDNKVINSNRYLLLISNERMPDTIKARLIMTDSSGNIIRENFYSSSVDYTNCERLYYKNPSNIFAVGMSDHINPNFGNMYLLKTDTTLTAPVVGIQNISTKTPSKYSLSQNYPNPFNSICNVQFSTYNAGQVKLTVYDIQGREVQTLVNERLQPGTYEAAFDGSMLTSGVYFYKLVTDGFTETKRMILIK